MANYDAAGALATVTGADCHIAAYDQKVDIASVSKSPTTHHHHGYSDSGFLILAPVLSTDYPSASSSRASSVNSVLTPAPVLSSSGSPPASAIDDSAPADAAEQLKKERRTSSVSSNGGFRRRILKLGPVHNGGELGVSDYAEVDDE